VLEDLQAGLPAGLPASQLPEPLQAFPGRTIAVTGNARLRYDPRPSDRSSDTTQPVHRGLQSCRSRWRMIGCGFHEILRVMMSYAS
jgi:hypothetical protein